MDTGDYQGAAVDYIKATEVNPNHANAFHNLCYLQIKHLNDNYGAISNCTKSLGIYPDSSNTYSIRGDAKKNIGDINGACADWRRASDLGDEDSKEQIRDEC